MRDKITFSVSIAGNYCQVETYTAEYRNLMVLINDRFYPDYFGECGGQGRCGTCMVIIKNGNLELYRHSGNESTTLIRNTALSDNIRLSCNIQIDKYLEGALIEVLESLLA